MTQVTPQNASAAFNAFNIDTPDTETTGEVGSVIVRVMPGVNNVQQSNFNNGSFSIENTGDKRIVGVYFDHSTALYQDSVWDPDGTGGDNAFKELQIDSDDGTEVNAVTENNYFQAAQNIVDGQAEDPLFRDGVAGGPADGGFRGLLLSFNADSDDANVGFTEGEVVTFSGDMDPNSIAGYSKGTVDGGSQPNWDVGGVSGAELMGTTITVLFSDGTTATAQLMSDNSQGGAQALITQDSPEKTVSLTVNDITSDGPGEVGGAGAYNETDPVVTVTGTPGDTVRVVLTKGHNPVQNPTNNAAQVVEDRLADEVFKANNAAEFQFADVVIGQDGTATIDSFNYDDIANNITTPFDGDDELPLGFMAAVINEDGFAVGPVTAPIYLEFEPGAAAPVALNDAITVAEGDGATVIDVLGNDSDANGDDLTVSSVDDDQTIGQVTLVDGVVRYDPNGQFESLAAGQTATDSFSYTVSDGNGGFDTATVTVTITGENDSPTAVDDAPAGIDEDAVQVEIDVLGNDSDLDGDGLTVQSVDDSQTQGDVFINGQGQVRYTPGAAFQSLGEGETATDSFSYTISDGNGGTDSATVTLTITGSDEEPGNSAPTAADDTPAAIVIDHAIAKTPARS